MKIKGLIILASLSAAALALADGGHHGNQGKNKHHTGELVRTVRDATRRYHDVRQAEADGYHLMFGCVSGPDDGAFCGPESASSGLPEAAIRSAPAARRSNCSCDSEWSAMPAACGPRLV